MAITREITQRGSDTAFSTTEEPKTIPLESIVAKLRKDAKRYSKKFGPHTYCEIKGMHNNEVWRSENLPQEFILYKTREKALAKLAKHVTQLLNATRMQERSERRDYIRDVINQMASEIDNLPIQEALRTSLYQLMAKPLVKDWFALCRPFPTESELAKDEPKLLQVFGIPKPVVQLVPSIPQKTPPLMNTKGGKIQTIQALSKALLKACKEGVKVEREKQWFNLTTEGVLLNFIAQFCMFFQKVHHAFWNMVGSSIATNRRDKVLSALLTAIKIQTKNPNYKISALREMYYTISSISARDTVSPVAVAMSLLADVNPRDADPLANAIKTLTKELKIISHNNLGFIGPVLDALQPLMGAEAYSSFKKSVFEETVAEVLKDAFKHYTETPAREVVEKVALRYAIDVIGYHEMFGIAPDLTPDEVRQEINTLGVVDTFLQNFTVNTVSEEVNNGLVQTFMTELRAVFHRLLEKLPLNLLDPYSMMSSSIRLRIIDAEKACKQNLKPELVEKAHAKELFEAAQEFNRVYTTATPLETVISALQKLALPKKVIDAQYKKLQQSHQMLRDLYQELNVPKAHQITIPTKDEFIEALYERPSSKVRSILASLLVLLGKTTHVEESFHQMQTIKTMFERKYPEVVLQIKEKMEPAIDEAPETLFPEGFDGNRCDFMWSNRFAHPIVVDAIVQVIGSFS